MSTESLPDACHESFGGKACVAQNPQGNEEGRGAEYHLDFGYNGPPFSAGTSKCSEWSWGNHRTGSSKAAEVTARDVILLMPHNDGIHDKEASPWQPECVLLGDEWSTLKVEAYGDAPVGHQVKTRTKTCTMSDRMNVNSHIEEEKHIFQIKQK